MKVRLQGKGSERAERADAAVRQQLATAPVARRALSHREFLKTLGAAVGIAGVAQLVTSPRRAEAADGTFDNLTVNTAAGIGTAPVSGAALTVANGRLQVTGDSTPSGGSGVEIGNPAGVGWILAYDHATTAYRNLRITGLSIRLENSGAECVRITGANVGIGTTSPSAKLHVVGNAKASGSIAWGAANMLNVDQGGSIELGDSTLSGTTPFIDFHYGVGQSQDYNIRLINIGDGKLRLQGGELGIGITPDATLHLATSGQMKIGTRVVADSSGSYYA